MARRAGVTPFSMAVTTTENPSSSHCHQFSSQLPRQQYSRADTYRHAHNSLTNSTGSIDEYGSETPSPQYRRNGDPTMPIPSPLPSQMQDSRPFTTPCFDSSLGFGLEPSTRQKYGYAPGRVRTSFGSSSSNLANADYQYHENVLPTQWHQEVYSSLTLPRASNGPLPLPCQERSGRSGMLPSFAEVMAGVSPVYVVPTYPSDVNLALGGRESCEDGTGTALIANRDSVKREATTGAAHISSVSAGRKRRTTSTNEPREQRRQLHLFPQS